MVAITLRLAGMFVFEMTQLNAFCLETVAGTFFLPRNRSVHLNMDMPPPSMLQMSDYRFYLSFPSKSVVMFVGCILHSQVSE
jgi:hypothetical protein